MIDQNNKISNRDYYIMGYGKLGKYLKNYFANILSGKFLGFIDNNAIDDNIFKPESIKDRNQLVFVGSINYIYEMTLQLKNLGYTNIIDFGKLTLEYPELQKFNPSFLGLKEDYILNKNKYNNLKKIFNDEQSLKVLKHIVEYRKTYNIENFTKIANNIEKQYFEEFLPKNIEVFIDGGGYDGDSTLRALKYIKPKKIYFFEPDKYNLDIAKKNLKHVKNIHFLPFGISDKNKKLKFKTNEGLGSCFSDNGDIEIECVSLDEIIKENKAYIKFDIEGAEIAGINGAIRLLKNGSPFAICVYHNPSDIWKIPELLLGILAKNKNLKYKFYLRHYTKTICDTVLYGVPESP